MPWSIPSLLERSRQVWTYVRGRLPGADGELWPNNLRIIGKVIAMAAHEGDLRGDYLFKQIFSATAEGGYLDLHAYEVGLARRAPSYAHGTATFAASPGVTFAAGLRLVRSDGAYFVTTAPATAVGNSVTFEVLAEDGGSIGNTPSGAALRVEASVPDLADTGEVDADGLGGGFEGETNAQLRARILFRKRNPPRGGAAVDYVVWSTEVAGIRTAYVKGWEPGAGAVSVYPILNGSGAAAIPTVADLEATAANIDVKRPLTATVYVLQAVERVIPITVTVRPDTNAVRSEVLAELADMFDERAVVALPGETTKFEADWIDEAISAAIGEDSHDLTVPAADIILAPGEFPVLGAVTFAP